ncbi:hypothetical protein D3C77_493010 [compost metagenome]
MQSALPKQPLLPNKRGHFLHQPLGLAIPVMIGQAQQFAVMIQQAKIHAPCIHPAAHRLITSLKCLPYRVLDLLQQHRDIPVQMIADLYRGIRKSVNFRNVQSAWMSALLPDKLTDQRPAAAGS